VAYSLELKSEHPLARAIVNRGESEGATLLETSDFEIFAGGGLSAKIGADTVVGGNAEFVERYAHIDEDMLNRAAELAREGKTATFFAKNGRMLGIIALADRLKDDSREAVAALKGLGIRVVMLTGDGKVTAEAIGREVGIDEIYAELRPEGKEATVRELKRSGRVAMVGDGINDAPSLTSADVGIAIGAGADVAIDAADAVLVNGRLSDVCAAIRLGRATLRIIRENLFWAFIYNVICIPVAAGAFAWAGFTLNPMLGAAAMSLSSFCVVSNALRLNLINIGEPKKENREEKEIQKVEKIIKIEGMMCPHCEARVKKVLLETAGVESAQVSHKEGTAVVMASASDELLTKVITENGYKVVDISAK
jgi:Cu2+-exporting ATPase